MKNVIALDIGNVCFKLNPPLYKNSTEDVAVLLSLTNLFADMELGKISEKFFMSETLKFTNHKFDKKAIRNTIFDIIGNEIQGMNEIVTSLTKKGFNFCFFSDTSPMHLAYTQRTLTFAHLVVGGVYSFEAGAFKPNNKMYELFEYRYGTPVLYIDDKIENCEGGSKRGWNSHQFHSIEKLKKITELL